eukprot:scaffold32858_cov79-Isochrysis_galbana.AAC.1
MKVVRSARPGICARSRSSRAAVAAAPGRRILCRTDASMCWRGMSIYLTTWGEESRAQGW